MKVTVIGFLGGYPAKEIGTTSYLIQTRDFNLLLDVGSGAVLSLSRVLDPLELDAVLLTHYHPDHVADVGVLQHVFLLKNTDREKEILPMYGHTESELASMRSFEGVSEAMDVREEDVLEIGPFEVQFQRTIHPVPCFAVRMKENSSGKTLVFTADSGYFEGLVDFSKDADLLIGDAQLHKGMENHPVHMTAGEVARIARDANIPKAILSHLPPEGDWEQLLHEAQEVAPSVAFILPTVGQSIEIG